MLTSIPGPVPRWWGLPFLLALRRDYLGFCERLHRDHGDLARVRILQERGVDLFRPDLVREALVDHADALMPCRRSAPSASASCSGR